jgi:hypothetical protein
MPTTKARGMGSQLVELAKKLSPGKLQLYPFECDDQLRAF